MRDDLSTPTAHQSETPDAPALRLVKDKPLDEVGPYRFERRQRARWSASGQVTMVSYGDDTDDTPGNKRIGSLQLIDLSTTGMGAWSQAPLPVGSRIAIFFPQRGSEHGFDRFGKVVRCQPSQDQQGYDLGLELETHVQNSAA